MGAQDEHYVRRFVKLLEEYEEVQNQLGVITPGEGEVEVLIWPDCGERILDRVWEGR